MTTLDQNPSVTTERAALRTLPLGRIRPAGWLAEHIALQLTGMAGRLDEHWPSLRDSSWIGGSADGWERGPYWLDGIVPLAHITGDATLLAKVQRWIDAMLAQQSPDGWIGPEHGDREGMADQDGRDVWPRAIILKAFLQHFDATGDPRLVPAMLRLCRSVEEEIVRHGLTAWARYRAFELTMSVHTLYELTGEAWLLDLATAAHAAAYPWRSFPEEMPAGKITSLQLDEWRAAAGRLLPELAMSTHGVNVAMGLKAPAVEWLYTGDDSLQGDLDSLLRALDMHHGLPNGLFSSDEHLAGTHPSQGSETCGVVEQMFSLETVLRVWGLNEGYAARLERLAFNALPAAATPDDTGHQYDQQPNQVVCHVTDDRIYSDNGPDANIFGLEPHFGCCTANRHQGWPKFVASLWAEDVADGALVALSYAPSSVRHVIGDATLQIDVRGEYPFEDAVHLTVRSDVPVTQRLRLRVPEWAVAPQLRVDDERAISLQPGQPIDINRVWGTTDTKIRLDLPAEPHEKRNADGTVTVQRGPLTFVYPIPEEWRVVADHGWMRDYEVHPAGPWAVALVDGSVESVVTRPSRDDYASHGASTVRVALNARVRSVSNWNMEHGAASAPPSLPVVSGDATPATLVPYATARLRITGLPVVHS